MANEQPSLIPSAHSPSLLTFKAGAKPISLLKPLLEEGWETYWRVILGEDSSFVNNCSWRAKLVQIFFWWGRTPLVLMQNNKLIGGRGGKRTHPQASTACFINVKGSTPKAFLHEGKDKSLQHTRMVKKPACPGI